MDEQADFNILPDNFINECLEWKFNIPMEPSLYFKGEIIFELEKLRYLNLFENETK
jgi:hypothetical protein